MAVDDAGEAGRILETHPTTRMQRSIWDACQARRNAFNTNDAIRWRGALDRTILTRSIDEIARGQDILRTTFELRGEQLVQHVHEVVPCDLHESDLSALPEQGREERVREVAAAELARDLEIERRPPFFAKLFRFAPDDHVMLFTHHHLIWDGWTSSLYFNALMEIYNAFAEGRASPYRPPRLTFGALGEREHAQWRDRTPQSIEHWRDVMARMPARTELPPDRPHRGAPRDMRRIITESPADYGDLLSSTAQRVRQSEATLRMAACNTILHQRTGDANVFTFFTAMLRMSVDEKRLFGPYTTVLPLNLDFAGHPSFPELAARVQQSTIAAIRDHSFCSELIMKEMGFPPGNTRVNALVGPSKSQTPQAAAISSFSVPNTVVFQNADCSLRAMLFPEGGIGCEYDANMFERDTVQRFQSSYLALLRDVFEHPDATVAELCRRLETSFSG